MFSLQILGMSHMFISGKLQWPTFVFVIWSQVQKFVHRLDKMKIINKFGLYRQAHWFSY